MNSYGNKFASSDKPLYLNPGVYPPGLREGLQTKTENDFYSDTLRLDGLKEELRNGKEQGSAFNYVDPISFYIKTLRQSVIICCMLRFRRRRRVVRRGSITKHYIQHKETARAFVHERVVHWNSFYNFEINRIAIRNQRTCWGSCSELKNLNFSYKILFLPQHLVDYIIVHELCHLGELNHSPQFWALVGETQPEYKILKKELSKTTNVLNGSTG